MKLTVRGDSEETYFTSEAGLLQGETTSPILFSIFVNDLENSLNDDSIGTNIVNVLIKLLMFADDMAIFSESRKGLQDGLNKLYLYCTKWGITVNTLKQK